MTRKAFTDTREAARRLQADGLLPRSPPSPLVSNTVDIRGFTLRAALEQGAVVLDLDEDGLNPDDDNPIQGSDRVVDHATNPARSLLDPANPVGSRSGWMWKTVYDWIVQKMQSPTPETGQFMHWQGEWKAGLYKIGSVVRDGLWTMVANKETSDVPAPLLAGSASWQIPDVPGGADQSPQTTLVRTGMQWTSGKTESDMVLDSRFWIPQIGINIDYRIFLLERLPDDSVRFIVDREIFPESAPGWHHVKFQGAVLEVGKTYELILQAQNFTTSFEFTAPWGFSSGTANYVPLPGEIYYKSNENLLTVHNIDDNGTDREVSLNQVIPGTIIRFGNGAEMTVDALGVADGTRHGFYGSFSGFPTTGVQTVEFSIPTPANTKYHRIDDYWVTNAPADVSINGLISLDGAVATLDLHGYGVDLLIDQVQFSPDWDIVALSADLTV